MAPNKREPIDPALVVEHLYEIHVEGSENPKKVSIKGIQKRVSKMSQKQMRKALKLSHEEVMGYIAEDEEGEFIDGDFNLLWFY
jgi:hypothetical protein